MSLHRGSDVLRTAFKFSFRRPGYTCIYILAKYISWLQIRLSERNFPVFVLLLVFLHFGYCLYLFGWFLKYFIDLKINIWLLSIGLKRLFLLNIFWWKIKILGQILWNSMKETWKPPPDNHIFINPHWISSFYWDKLGSEFWYLDLQAHPFKFVTFCMFYDM